MIRIKRIKRVSIAVKDLEASVQKWSKLFGIKPYQRGEEPEDKYAFVAFQIGNTRGDGETTLEFLSPWKDPEGEMLIGKVIKKHGEGLYMITLETEGTWEEVDSEIQKTGIKSGWGGQLKHWTAGQEGLGHKSWTEHYLSPKDTNGALITLASIEYLDPEVVYTGPGRTIRGQS